MIHSWMKYPPVTFQPLGIPKVLFAGGDAPGDNPVEGRIGQVRAGHLLHARTVGTGPAGWAARHGFLHRRRPVTTDLGRKHPRWMETELGVVGQQWQRRPRQTPAATGTLSPKVALLMSSSASLTCDP